MRGAEAFDTSGYTEATEMSPNYSPFNIPSRTYTSSADVRTYISFQSSTRSGHINAGIDKFFIYYLMTGLWKELPGMVVTTMFHTLY